MANRLNEKLHRRESDRGLKGVLATPKAERFLDEALLAATSTVGTPGHIGFDDADFVIQIETIDHRAGMALWGGEDMQRYPFLGASR